MALVNGRAENLIGCWKVAETIPLFWSVVSKW